MSDNVKPISTVPQMQYSNRNMNQTKIEMHPFKVLRGTECRDREREETEEKSLVTQ